MFLPWMQLPRRIQRTSNLLCFAEPLLSMLARYSAMSLINWKYSCRRGGLRFICDTMVWNSSKIFSEKAGGLLTELYLRVWMCTKPWKHVKWSGFPSERTQHRNNGPLNQELHQVLVLQPMVVAKKTGKWRACKLHAVASNFSTLCNMADPAYRVLTQSEIESHCKMAGFIHYMHLHSIANPYGL